MYFVMPSCGVFSALLRNWDIAGWDGRDHLTKLQLVSPLLARIALAGHLGLAAAFLCTVLSSYFASSRSQSFGSPCLLLALLFSVLFILLTCSTMSAALRARRRFSTSLSPTLRVQLFDVLLAVLVPVLLHFILLFTTCSLAVVPFLILSPLALTLSLILSRDTLWQFTASWMPRLHLQHHYSTLRPS